MRTAIARNYYFSIPTKREIIAISNKHNKPSFLPLYCSRSDATTTSPEEYTEATTRIKTVKKAIAYNLKRSPNSIYDQLKAYKAKTLSSSPNPSFVKL